MSGKENIVKLHSTLASGAYGRVDEHDTHPHVKKMYDQPHLAVFINGDWLPILPGMIIGLVKNRAHVDGVAPYIFKKVNVKPGKEFIDLVAWSSDRTSTRRLQLIANYSGVYRSGVDNADQAIDSAINAQKGADAVKDE